MKIAHINEYYGDFGGTEQYLFTICKALEEMGHEIIIISSEKESIHVPGRKEYFIKCSYGLRSSLKTQGLLKEILKKENPDIVHLHNTQFFLSPFILKYLLRAKPVVKTVHDVRLICPGFKWKVIPDSGKICNYPMGLKCFKNGCYPFYPEKRSPFWNLYKFFLMLYELRISKSIDKIIVPSSYMKEQLVRNGFQKDNVTVIPHYVNKAPIQEKETKDSKSKKILFVGKFYRIKGILHFIECLSLLKERNWMAEIIGEGYMREEATTLVHKLGLNDRIHFPGNLSKEELNKHYAACTVVVIPSIVPESFGLVGIEAMSFGKPVVAFDSGGIREWLIHNETGFLVRRGDVRELSDRIFQLLEDPSLAKKMGFKGQQRVNELYRKEIHVIRLLTVYEEAIKSKMKILN